MINGEVYKECMRKYIQEALASTDGSNARVAEYLGTIVVKGWFVRNKEEKLRALADTRRAFEEHRHWPLDIVLSHLGFELKDVT
jgi:hypothetical protein